MSELTQKEKDAKLRWAVRARRRADVAHWLAAGAHPGAPLFVDAMALTKDTFRLLVSAGADVNARYGITGRTPLFRLAEYGGNWAEVDQNRSATIAQWFLSAGSDPNAEGGLGTTVLSYVVQLGHEPMFDVLMRRGDLSQRSLDTALIQAVEHAREDCARRLIDRGADVDLRHQGKTLAQLIPSHMPNQEAIRRLLRSVRTQRQIESAMPGEERGGTPAARPRGLVL